MWNNGVKNFLTDQKDDAFIEARAILGSMKNLAIKDVCAKIIEE